MRIEDPEYVELIDKRAIREIQHKRDMKARDDKDRAQNQPSASLDWFLIGDVDVLKQNLAKITNTTDQGKILARISHLEKEPV